MFGYGQLYKYNIDIYLAKVLLPIIILPNLIFNCVSNLNNLNLLNIVSYLRLVRIDSNIDYVLFVTIGGLCFSGLAKCYMGRYEYKYKIMLFVYSMLFWILIIHHTIVFLPKSFPIVPPGATVDQFDLDIFLEIVISALVIVFILRIVTEKFSVIYYAIKYIFLIIELIVGLYVGIAFIDLKAGSDVTDIQLIVVKISIIIIGFALFIVIERIKDKIYNYIDINELDLR